MTIEGKSVVVDAETTGIGEGHRIVEIAAVEIINRRVTGRVFQAYVNPQRSVDPEAFNVHGLSEEFLQDKPLFETVGREFLNFIKGGEVVAHNAGFDVDFIDREIKLAGGRMTMEVWCEGIVDTVPLARSLFPGQRNSLDALCKRYKIDLSARKLHGALLDCQLLASCYLLMTQTQNKLILADSTEDSVPRVTFNPSEHSPLVVTPVSDDAMEEHRKYLARLNDTSEGNCAQW